VTATIRRIVIKSGAMKDRGVRQADAPEGN